MAIVRKMLPISLFPIALDFVVKFSEFISENLASGDPTLALAKE